MFLLNIINKKINGNDFKKCKEILNIYNLWRVFKN